MYIFFVLAIVTIAFLTFINRPIPAPIFGIYRQPDKWYMMKTAVVYSFIKIKQIIERLKTEDSEEARPERKKWHKIEKMECSKKFLYHPQAFDGVYFTASNMDGYFLATAIGRRLNGIVNGFFIINIPHVGLLESMKLPDTILYQDEEEKSLRLFSAEGLCYIPLKPLRKWRISYDGEMRFKNNSKEKVDVHLDAIWSSNQPFFDIDTDTDPMLVAKIFAREPWNDEFFEFIKSFRLTHYEQHGNIDGFMLINGKNHKITMNSLKRRNYGVMQWKHFHRYVTHFMTFQDGTNISLGIFCVPVTFSSREYGYICKPNGDIIPITFCSLKLHEHGEGGLPPNDYSFSIKAGGRSYHIRVEVLKFTEFYAGWQWEARFVECMAKFSFNGNIGWGGIEWHYSNTGNRPPSVSSKDPAWTVRKYESPLFPLYTEVDYGTVVLPFSVNKI